MSVFYRGPLGDVEESPDAEFLRDVASKPEDYWASGGGDSCLEVHGGTERMLFFFDEPYGFFVMMHPNYEVVVRSTEQIKTIEHRVGGEPMKVPSCCYFTRDEAYELMLEFVRNEGKPTSYEWQDMYELEFDHGF